MNIIGKFTGSALLSFVTLGVVPGWETAARAQGNLCCLPVSPICFSPAASSNSFADITFSQIPAGYSVTNGVYPAWCVEFEVEITESNLYKALLFDSNGTLPAHLQNNPWDKVNYILNHKQGTASDIQNAIWSVLGQSNVPPFTANAQSMTNDAHQFGMGFVPTNGQVQGVIVDPQETPPVQRVMCETVCVPDTDTNQPSNATFSSPAYLPGGDLKFLLTAQAGRCFVIESSTDLVNWTPLITLIRTNGVMEFTDTNAMNFNRRFYRARRS